MNQRKEKQSPLRNKYLNNEFQQQRNQVSQERQFLRTSLSPYGHSSLLQSKPPVAYPEIRRSSQNKTIEYEDYPNQQSIYQPSGPSVEAKLRIDERHEELKRQIAMKEKLLAEMQSERESTRRLRVQGSSTINQQSLQSFMIEESNRRGISNENPYQQVRKSPVKQVGMIGLKSTHLVADSLSRDTSPQQNIYTSSLPVRQQQLQFYPSVNQPKNIYQEQNGSPFRQNEQKSRSRSRSKSKNGNKIENYPSIDQIMSNRQNQRVDLPFRKSQNSPFRYPQNNQINQQRLSSVSPIKDNLQGSQRLIHGQIPQAPALLPSQIIQISVEAREKLYRDRIETMTLDNSSLQRRLKHVSEDLERLRKEKDELTKQMRLYVTDNDKLHRAVNQKDEIDMENQSLQEELEKARNNNRKLENQLQTEQIQTNKTVQILDHTNFDNKNLVYESSSMTADLQKKLRMIEDLSRDHAEILTKINLSNIELDKVNQQDVFLNHDNIDLATQLAKLQNERNELYQQVQHLNLEFDDIVRETMRDRRILSDRSKWQSKLITSKVLEKNLQRMLNQRVQKSFKELSEYANFDRNCHRKLKAFSKVANKLGLFKQKTALYQWYVAALKPLLFRYQNVDISLMIEANRIQSRVFYAWKNILRAKIDSYHLKSRSIEKTWFLLSKTCRNEMKRAISIWKEKSRYQSHKVKKYINLLRTIAKKVLLKNFTMWQKQNLNLELAVRAKIVQKESIEKLLLSQCFSQLKLVTKYLKTCRIRNLNHILKGWKEHIRQNRHLMQANMAAIKFVEVNKNYVMKNCFDALKINKEVKKQRLIQTAVEEEMKPAIQCLEEFNYEKSTQILTKSQLRAGFIVRDMMGKKLNTYFKKWVEQTQKFRIMLTKNISDRLIKYSKQQLWGAFCQWKNNALKRVNKIGETQNLRTQKENEKLCKDAMEKEKQLRMSEELIKFQKRKLLDKLVRKFIFRKQQIATKHWLQICNTKQKQEQKYSKILTQMKKRLFKDAFQSYISFIKWSRQHDKNINKSLYFLNKLNRKKKQKVYSAILFFSNRQLRAKRYWNKILNKMDKFLKLRTMSLWRQNSGLKYQDQLLSNQKQITDIISDRNQRISTLENCQVDQNDQIHKAEKLRRKKAHRQIANYFIRTYTFQSNKYFKLWKQINQETKHKQSLIKKQINQWRMISFQYCKQAFKKFVSYQRQQEAVENIKRKMIDQVATQTNIVNDKEKNEANTEQKLIELEVIQNEQQYKKALIQKLMLILERRNHEWIFVSRKRMIFKCWRHAVRQQKAFLICVKNVLQKSMYVKGFYYIKNSHEDTRYSERVTRYLQRFMLKAFRINCNDSFNKWKKFSLAQVDKRINTVVEDLTEKNNQFSDHIKQIKKTNTSRVYNFLIEKNKKLLFYTLLNVAKHNKLMKNKTFEFQSRQKVLRKNMAIKLWKLRNQKSMYQQTREQILIMKIKKRYLRACFNGLNKKFKETKNLVNNLGQLEKFWRDKIMSDAFKTIKTFQETKQISYTQDKYVSTHDIIRIARQNYHKSVRNYFQNWRNTTNSKSQKQGRLKMLLSKHASFRLRNVFQWWLKKDQKSGLLQEMYFEGPVRGEDWEAQREISNLKQFMREQRFTEDEIESLVEKVNNRNENIMRKFIIRMQLKVSRDKKYLPYCFDRLKSFVAIRKLIRYQFRFCHNQTNNVKADLQRAFNKWNRGYESLNKELSKLDSETLVDLAVRSTVQVGKCSEQLAENQAISNHLMIQRDEFLNYYIKSQMLAFALVKDRSRFAQMQAWSRWFNKWHYKKMQDYNRDLRDNTYLHANLLAREKELTEKNRELKTENAELSEFTKDSQIVKNNMLKLKKDRDDVLLKLQETDEDFLELQRENEKLKLALQKVEENAGSSKNRKFLQQVQLKVTDQENKKPNNQKETTEEKKKREQQERFQRLQALQAGSSIR